MVQLIHSSLADSHAPLADSHAPLADSHAPLDHSHDHASFALNYFGDMLISVCETPLITLWWCNM